MDTWRAAPEASKAALTNSLFSQQMRVSTPRLCAIAKLRPSHRLHEILTRVGGVPLMRSARPPDPSGPGAHRASRSKVQCAISMR